MDEKSYSRGMALRPEHLAQRHWTFVPVGEKELVSDEVLTKKYAKEVMDHLVKQDMAAMHSWMTKMGTKKAKDAIVSRFETHGNDFMQALRNELDVLGYEDWVASALAWDGTEVDKSDNVSRTSKGSQTALVVAYFRDLAYKLGFGPDGLASAFIPDSYLTHMEPLIEDFKRTGDIMLKGPEAKAQQENEPWNVVLNLACFIQCRTCFLDDVVMQFVEQFVDGPCNVVILGAGFDTRFYRLKIPGSVLRWEVDTAGTQKRKLEALDASKLDFQARDLVTFVECDFVTQSWVECLLENGFRNDFPTLIVFEGVIYYLSKEKVEDIFEMVRVKFRAPAAIAFDYFSPRLLEKHEAQQASAEPWLFGIEPEGLEGLVGSKGLGVADHLTVLECAQRYLPVNSEGETLGAAGDFKAFMLATNGKWDQ